MNSFPAARGYIALISVLLISTVLTVLVLTENQAAFFTRMNMLDTESNTEAKAAVHSCIQLAALGLATETYSIPLSTPQSIPLYGNQSCSIDLIEGTPVDATIHIHARTNASVSFAQAHLLNGKIVSTPP
jgi:hypothetical protein